MRSAEGKMASLEEKSGDFVLTGVQQDRGTVKVGKGIPYKEAAGNV